jgi:predicted phage baseplate assembly protein
VLLRQLVPEERDWRWVRSILAADRAEACFSVEPGRYRTVVQLPEGAFSDVDSADGALICFGNGDFGALPNDGDVYQVRSRSSRGRVGLVPAESITQVDPAWSGLILAAWNPLPASGGADAETDEQVRRRAPQAFQSEFYRAVRPEDYDAAANRLPWVQRAGTVFRWTGSWPTVFSTADPISAGQISTAQHIELIALLNRCRLAGYEAYAPRPRYVSFDLRIRLCGKPDAYRGDVRAGVERALAPARHADGSSGFFFFGNFTLGSPFERSRLEAAIQRVPGVAGVLAIDYRRRGQSTGFITLPAIVPFAPGEIFRLDNDNNHPERGSYRLDIQGSK